MGNKYQAPEWIKKAIRKANARERYYMKRYGNLDRMHDKDGAEQARIDDEEFDNEIEYAKSLKEERRQKKINRDRDAFEERCD